jgi:maltose alpha-D-glucosyltransferase/alpha-amylase
MSGQERSGVTQGAEHHGMSGSVRENHWYKQAIIYALDVETFQDSDGDGVGDFAGLRDRLDYLVDLGVTCLWLTPFYRSPNRDNGYDVTDHLAVDPRLGTLDDFFSFRKEATTRGIRIIIDLVANHTSDEHPWFQSARADPASPFRNFYVWSDDPHPTDETVTTSDGEESVWARDPVAEAWYRHQFYAFQPDLATGNPAVQAALCDIEKVWLERGVDGVRIDAARHLGRRPEDPSDPGDPHAPLRALRACAATIRPDAALLAEADAPPDKLASFIGDGDEVHLLQNFLLDNYLFLALARERAEPLARGLGLMPPLPPAGQWANYLRNFDELDLEQLTDDERQEVLRAFAPDPEMRLYKYGLRRRLAPMLDGDPRRIRLALSLLLSLPGTPLLLYCDELGMGEDLSRPERQALRAPMPWSNGRNGGFSTARADRLVAAPLTDDGFGHRRVNVATQHADPGSLLNWVRRAVSVKKACPEIGSGTCRVLETDQPAVLAHGCDWAGGHFVAVHNLAHAPCSVRINTGDLASTGWVDLLGDDESEPGGGPSRIKIGPYGFRWFRLVGAAPEKQVPGIASAETLTRG